MNSYAVFLLETDDLVREAFLGILEHKDYAVYPFKNHWESASFIKKIQFQIALIDINSGDYDIRDLIKNISEISPTPSVILTATHPEVDDMLSFFNQDVGSILLKPVNIKEMDNALEKAAVSYQKRVEVKELKQKISELKQEKEQIETSLKKAASNLPLAELARSLTHEFKNVLTTINLSANFIEKISSPEDVRIKKHFNLISQGVEHANDLTLRLLGLTREKKELINFKIVLETTLQILETELKNCGIRIQSVIGENLPELILDSASLKQVLINIMLNAKDAMPRGGQLGVKAYLMEEESKGYVVIEINDTGCGISSENLDQIFTPTYTTKEKGNGIGLYISQKIIEDMGGKIKTDSVLNRGSSFKIMLPFKQKVHQTFTVKR
ncbi:MAG: ATP-binding protein [Candidatus Saelkia tenebricola]|nr:ATP-binding protein [Candidatus Saelkia tenebricola]